MQFRYVIIAVGCAVFTVIADRNEYNATFTTIPENKNSRQSKEMVFSRSRGEVGVRDAEIKMIQMRQGRSKGILLVPSDKMRTLPKVFLTAGFATQTKLGDKGGGGGGWGNQGGGGGGGGWGGGGGGGNGGGWGGGGGGGNGGGWGGGGGGGGPGWGWGWGPPPGWGSGGGSGWCPSRSAQKALMKANQRLMKAQRKAAQAAANAALSGSGSGGSGGGGGGPPSGGHGGGSGGGGGWGQSGGGGGGGWGGGNQGGGGGWGKGGGGNGGGGGGWGGGSGGGKGGGNRGGGWGGGNSGGGWRSVVDHFRFSPTQFQTPIVTDASLESEIEDDEWGQSTSTGSGAPVLLGGTSEPRTFNMLDDPLPILLGYDDDLAVARQGRSSNVSSKEENDSSRAGFILNDPVEKQSNTSSSNNGALGTLSHAP